MYYSDVTCGQVRWPLLGICALYLSHPKCTHTAVNTHTVNTHTHSSEHTHREHTHSSEHTHREHTPGAVGSHLCSGARGAVGGPVPCSRVSGIEGGERELYIHSLHLQCIYNILHIYKYVHLFMCNTFLDIYVMYMHIHPKTLQYGWND